MTPKTLHIVFDDNTAKVLQRALSQAGRRDGVIWFPDDLGLGPIDPPDPVAREKWVRQEFGSLYLRGWPVGRAESFWRSALSTRRRRVVWVCRHVVWDYAGFLEFSRRAGDSAYDVVDIMTAAHPDDDGGNRRLFALHLGDLYREPAAVLGLLAKARPLAEAEADLYRASWDRLRAENAPLRVLTESGLHSAAADHFDALLLSCVVGPWRKAARILGEALSKSNEGGFYQVGEVVLGARLRALAAAGRIDSRGDLFRPRFSEIRLPGAGLDGTADQLSSSVSQ